MDNSDIQGLIEKIVSKSIALRNDKIIPGIDFISHASKVIDGSELSSGINAVLDGWLTSGRFTESFESAIAKFLQVRSATLVNSGSSANLVALSALTSSTLGDKRISPGSEVITVAASFPTTVNPIVQNGAVPVFLDITLPTYNINTNDLDEALSSKTKAVMIAHTLGNPFNLRVVQKFCSDNNLWLIEDNCDAFGSKYDGKFTGAYGDFSTLSFYPAHHITTGEGGAVVTSKPRLRVLAESFRDWGRDCYCLPGKDNTCLKRYSQKHGNLPDGYDHKFVYSHLGYNLKMTDLQASIGHSQMKKLPTFIEKRKSNWKILRESFSTLEDYFILPESEYLSDPSWYGFALTIRPEAKFERKDLLDYLNYKKIGTRLLFSGDIRKQPAYSEIKFRSIGDLNNTELVMSKTFWIGCWPGLDFEHLEYMFESIRDFCYNA